MTESPVPIERLKKLLDQKGVKPSYQRISVLKYIMEHMDHPSVDTIFKNLVNQIPTLSKTTVYNTLNLLTEKGVITALSIDGVEVKYDYIEIPHAHFKCIMCHKIYDVKLNSDIFKKRSLKGHKITEAQINLKGICKDCSQKISVRNN